MWLNNISLILLSSHSSNWKIFEKYHQFWILTKQFYYYHYIYRYRKSVADRWKTCEVSILRAFATLSGINLWRKFVAVFHRFPHVYLRKVSSFSFFFLLLLFLLFDRVSLRVHDDEHYLQEYGFYKSPCTKHARSMHTHTYIRTCAHACMIPQISQSHRDDRGL